MSEDIYKIVIVTTTAGSEEESDRLAAGLIEKRLAACVQSYPIKSTYRWQGKVECSAEYRMDCKTTDVLADKVVDYLRANHSYDLPEIILTPVSGGLEEYRKWVHAETEPL